MAAHSQASLRAKRCRVVGHRGQGFNVKGHGTTASLAGCEVAACQKGGLCAVEGGEVTLYDGNRMPDDANGGAGIEVEEESGSSATRVGGDGADDMSFI